MIRIIMLIAVFVWLTGCLNYNEEIHINSDLSGKVILKLEFGAMMQSMMGNKVDAMIDSLKALNDNSIEAISTIVDSLEDGLRITQSYSFKHIRDLGEVYKQMDTSEIASRIEIQENDEYMVVKKYMIPDSSLNSLSSGGEEEQAMMAMFGGMMPSFETTVFLEHDILYSNFDTSFAYKKKQAYKSKLDISNPSPMVFCIAKKKLKKMKNNEQCECKVYPQPFASDSLKKYLKGKKIRWGTINKVSSLKAPTGNEGNDQKSHYLFRVEIALKDGKNLIFGKPYTGCPPFEFKEGDRIPLIDSKGQLEVVYQYANFLGYKIVESGGRAVLKKL